MDMGRVLQMIINTVLRKVISGAVNKGFGMFARRDRAPVDQSSADPGAPQDTADTEKRARQIANQARRLR